MIVVRPLQVDLLNSWTELFRAEQCTCYCHYWHFEEDKNTWLERCATTPEANLEAMRVRARSSDPLGLVAMDSEVCVGWMKLGPTSSLTKLRNQSVYRRLPLATDNATFVVGCFLIRTESRRRGVAKMLLEAAPSFVRGHGGIAIEAYPHKVVGRVHDAHAWRGRASMFESFGYQCVAENDVYPVYRLEL